MGATSVSIFMAYGVNRLMTGFSSALFSRLWAAPSIVALLFAVPTDRYQHTLGLVHEPIELLLDEPTIGVDVLVKRHILEFVKMLNQERGVTIMQKSDQERHEYVFNAADIGVAALLE